jgi:hypothetical protein
MFNHVIVVDITRCTRIKPRAARKELPLPQSHHTVLSAPLHATFRYLRVVVLVETPDDNLIETVSHQLLPMATW